MIEIKIPVIKVISQNQKMQGRAMFRKGTRTELLSILNKKAHYLFCNNIGKFGYADMDEIMRFLTRNQIAMFYKTKKFKDFENNLRIEILKSIANKPRQIFRKDIQVLIQIKTYLDIDNPVKGIIDTLCAVGIIENDREIIKLKIVKYGAKRGSSENIIIKIDGRQ